MYIEIRKTGFVNKGAELMLYAILQKMQGSYPEANFVMAPCLMTAPYEKRAELKLYQKAYLWRYRIQWGEFACLIPRKILKMYGVILDREIDVVLDGSGFSYSDQWGIRSSIELANSCKRWKKRGTKVILLPQAFGPFTSSKIKECMRKAVLNADLIFARDHISYDHLTGVVGERPNIKMAPDFTNLVEGIVPDDFDRERNRFCLIPNYRMIDMTTKEQREAYLPFMIQSAKYLLGKEQKPFILVHEGGDDLMLAENISDAVDGALPIIKEDHPLKIKGILGACEGTIGSRFHGLVSALSQGVPSLATGWSHKYKMLFADYDFPEGLIDITSSQLDICNKIDLIINSDSKKEIKSRIKVKSQKMKELSTEMWVDVLNKLNER